jgi:UPF0271 protein
MREKLHSCLQLMLSPMRVDLNADLGEAAPSSGLDAAIMPALTSANIACGFHAGDPGVMRATVALARRHGVAVGAHPSFADREGFGRREMSTAPNEVENLVAYQVGALAAIAALEGVRVRHVKPHGALYNMAGRDRALAAAVARGVRAVDPSLVLFGPSGSALIELGRNAGLATASEVFADRAYRADGELEPRTIEGAVIHDPQVVVARAVSMVKEGAVVAVDGTRVPLTVETICVHGDTPGAAALAHEIRRALEGAGILVAPVSPPRP